MRKFVVALVLSLSFVQPVSAIEPATQAVALQAISALSSLINISKYFNTKSDQGYVVEVEGLGQTMEQAQNHAYLRAVDEAVGAYIGSHTEVRNGEVVRNDIVKHVTGYVRQYKILDSGMVRNTYIVRMQVWVADANIARGLLPIHTADGKVDGYQTTVQIQTYDASMKGAKDVLESVALSGRRGAAFKITTGTPKLVKANQVWQTQLPVKVKWNHEYLKSVIRASQRVQAKEPGWLESALDGLVSKAGTTCYQDVSAHDCRSLREKMDIRNIHIILCNGCLFGDAYTIPLDSDRWETLANALPYVVDVRVRVVGNSRGEVFNQCMNLGMGMTSVQQRVIVLNENDAIETEIVLPALRDDNYQIKIEQNCV